ncbi:type 2 isopentenyl-diphosphate Delta-isomerase [Methanosalsum natronophilum]|uniref:type 2 isopentenyl-diphosphate Delta-isomerase n=1 Tax=Methanosalsum natronophilum TaxID=768733 RepID=UPI0021694935|nr:type 2 isopentenyl-diphosphate Delta-isomerase [Methanosalsum natronophilum]MCS3924633.1 isopentenyl-diphosphate delta-isomerase [Methanosalsum natronophilum]
MSTSKRKIEHLKLCSSSPVESRFKNSGFDDISLVHRALPEMDMNEIDHSVSFFGKKLKTPFLIASITGGHPDTTAINAALAEAVEETGVGIGVGSQRAAIEDPEQESSFTIVRDKAPTSFIYGNIGAAQIREYGIEAMEKMIEVIDADAFAIHLNFLQEAIQPEGDVNATGVIDSISEICELDIPIIVKETGCGISHEDAILLKKAGVSAIDVGGVGGTSWAGVEVYRANTQSTDSYRQNVGELFWDFGIPTVASIVECDVSLPIIATGGVRSGLDVAKSISLGASVASSALPFIEPAFKGSQFVTKKIEQIIEELKISMFLTGCKNISQLKKSPLTVTGWTKEYLAQRGFDTSYFALKPDVL